jgi:pyridoxamine 5'-phosphate oxidase
MCLATADAAGRPSGRIVLLRGLDERGLAFYSSYLSRKAREISENPRAAATFFWPQLSRQVRVEGEIAQLPEDESEAYFASRPRGHQLSAWASEQSEPVDARTTLEARLEHFDQRFEGETVPRPHSWGGYVIAPDRFEFWSGRPNRLHDRHEFRLEGRTWTVRRLQP